MYTSRRPFRIEHTKIGVLGPAASNCAEVDEARQERAFRGQNPSAVRFHLCINHDVTGSGNIVHGICFWSAVPDRVLGFFRQVDAQQDCSLICRSPIS